jgi:F0F1-type ATP synthase membrane subunit a
MAWYNPFSWSDKVADNVLDKDKGLLAQVGSWVGNMNLTKEEVIEFNAKTVSSVQSFVKATLSESTERSKTRRAIAVLWIKTQLAIVLMCCIAAPFDLELAKFYFDLATSTLMITVTTAICIFFFGSHGIARHNETKK